MGHRGLSITLAHQRGGLRGQRALPTGRETRREYCRLTRERDTTANVLQRDAKDAWDHRERVHGHDILRRLGADEPAAVCDG